jgi:hypothetical protein
MKTIMKITVVDDDAVVHDLEKVRHQSDASRWSSANSPWLSLGVPTKAVRRMTNDYLPRTGSYAQTPARGGPALLPGFGATY